MSLAVSYQGCLATLLAFNVLVLHSFGIQDHKRCFGKTRVSNHLSDPEAHAVLLLASVLSDG